MTSDRGVGRLGRVEEFEEHGELAAAVAVLDQSMGMAGEQIDAPAMLVATILLAPLEAA